MQGARKCSLKRVRVCLCHAKNKIVQNIKG